VISGVKAGCDQNDGHTYSTYGMAAVQAGLMAESDVNRALSRILLQRFKVGAFDPRDAVSFRDIPIDVMDSAAHRALSLQAAREAITLLANVDKTLPLKKAPGTQIGVVGPFADYATAMLGGASFLRPSFELLCRISVWLAMDKLAHLILSEQRNVLLTLLVGLCGRCALWLEQVSWTTTRALRSRYWRAYELWCSRSAAVVFNIR
jgi:beta-glucosidase-like glycosyl hydrolase